ncbi:17594_t:CDS:1, partial [Rhizophagus irregularis]
ASQAEDIKGEFPEDKSRKDPSVYNSHVELGGTNGESSDGGAKTSLE